MSKKEDNAVVVKNEKRTIITLNLSPENKKAIKMYAVEKETTISALVNQWIEENCKVKK